MLRLIRVILIVISILGNAQNVDSIDFTIRNLGVNVDGHFNDFDIKTEFDTDSGLVSIFGKIDVATIETGIDSRDEHLLKEDYFYQTKFKHITLQSTSIKREGDYNYSVTAKLTIKGKTKQITIPVKIEVQNNKVKVVSTFEINRRDFDVGGGSFVMSKTVKIQVRHYQDLP